MKGVIIMFLSTLLSLFTAGFSLAGSAANSIFSSVSGLLGGGLTSDRRLKSDVVAVSWSQ